MDASRLQKQGNLRLVRIERTPEELLDLEVAEAFAALTVSAGKKPRAWYAIAEGERFPARVPARRVREACTANVTREAIRRALLRPIERYIDRKFGTSPAATGEYRAFPPAA